MLPKETELALFPARPRRFRAGWLRSFEVGPLTLRQAAVLEKYGCGALEGGLDEGKSLVALWILSLPRKRLDDAARGDTRGATPFVRGIAKRHLKGAKALVASVISDAFLPFVPPKRENGPQLVDDGIPHGYGWPLEVAEALCAHYTLSFEEALDMPVQRAFALVAVCRERTGGDKGGPDYYDRIRFAKWRKIGILGNRKKGGGNG